MVASMIIAVVGTALLKTTSNNRLFVQRFEKINAQNQILSFVAFNDTIDTDTKEEMVLLNDDYYLDDLLSQRYDFIKDDEVRKYYKEHKFHIKDELITQTNLQDIVASLPIDEENSDSSDDLSMPVDIKIINTSIQNKSFAKNIYKLRVEF